MRWFVASVIAVLLILPFTAPADFPVNKLVEIKQGESVSKVLAGDNVIYSSRLFSLVAKLGGKSGDLKAGRYLFDRKLTLWGVLGRVSRGEYGTKSIKITIPEGSTNAQISKITGLDMSEFEQGDLFPDTYFIDQFASAAEVREIMRKNFALKVGEISEEDVTMASIVEEEASSTQDRRMIADILMRRLKLNMPLQVDVSTSTYDRPGLPSEPITNPGLDSINAVRNPQVNKYLYYLSDKSGVIHYARTFAEHKANREKYGI